LKERPHVSLAFASRELYRKAAASRRTPKPSAAHVRILADF